MAHPTRKVPGGAAAHAGALEIFPLSSVHDLLKNVNADYFTRTTARGHARVLDASTKPGRSGTRPREPELRKGA